MSRDGFMGDRKAQSAVIRELLVVGEAAKRVSSEVRSETPAIPWREITGMRDVLVHDYRGIDLDVVWVAATESAEALIAALEPLISEFEDPEL